MQDFNWDFANGYGSLDQIGSSDLNQGICDTLGNCSLQQANPPESYSFQCDPSMSCVGTNTYDGCTRDVTFERIMIGDIPDGTSQANFPTSGHSVDPVNTFTGELFFYEEPDLALAGSPSVFRFLRYYSSKLVVGGYGDSHIGNNWAHNFGWRLDLRGANAAITTPEGRFIKFEKPASLWTLSQTYEAPFQLIENGQEFTFNDPRGNTRYIFDGGNFGRLIRIENGKGNVLTLTYDGNNRLIQVSDGLGRLIIMAYDGSNRVATVDDGTRVVTFAYGATGDLENVVDVRGGLTTYSYDPVLPGEGKMTGKTLPGGNTPYTQTYIDLQGRPLHGRVFSQFDASGNEHSFAYPTAGGGGTTGILNPESNIYGHSHTTTGELSNGQDTAGQDVPIGSDAAGRRNAIIDRLGDGTTVSYHEPSGKLASRTNADGTTINYAYTERVAGDITLHDLTGLSYADGTADSFVYDGDGNLTARTDRAGFGSSATYNANGQALTATNSLGGISKYTFNPDATPASTTDPAGNTTTFAQDALRRLNLVTHPDTHTRGLSYDADNRLLTSTDENSNTTTLTYDTNGNLVAAQNALLNTTTFAYDGNDRLLSNTDPLGGITSRSYDQLGRVNTTTDENGHVTILGYDLHNRLTAVTDPRLNVWATSYDIEGIIASSTDPLLNTTSFISDNMGRITRLTSPLGNISSNSYDLMGRVSTTTDALGNSTTIGRDARGLLSDITLPGGTITVGYTRNGFGQITQLTDANGNHWLNSYDNQGRQVASADPLGNSRKTVYDNRRRPATITFPDTLGTLTLGYDPAGNLTQAAYADGTTLNYTYDANNRLLAANGIVRAYDANDRISLSNGIIIDRDAGDRITAMTLAPGKTVTYAYDGNDNLTQVSDWAGGLTTFGYDAANRLTTLTRPNGITTTYSYDNDSRLIGISEGAISSIALSRDGKGQITAATRNVPAPPSITQSATTNLAFDAAAQVAAYSYDALGRLTDDGTRTYVWDLASRLSSYTDNENTVSFTYDALGRRTGRTAAAITTGFVWNEALDLTSISIAQQAGIDQTYYLHTPGGGLLYSIDATTDGREFYHFDERGNTLFVSNDAGLVIGSYAYTPFGRLMTTMGGLANPFTWQGQHGIMAEGNDVYYMRARYYDASTGRFISRDPVKSISPKEVNPYQYALNNPLVYIDVNGMETRPTGLNEVGAVTTNVLGHALEGGASTLVGVVGLGGDLASLANHLSEDEINTGQVLGDAGAITVDLGSMYLSRAAATTAVAEGTGALTGAAVVAPATFVYVTAKLGIANWEAYSDLQDTLSRIETARQVNPIRARVRARAHAEQQAQMAEETSGIQAARGRRDQVFRDENDARGEAANINSSQRQAVWKWLASLWIQHD